MRLSQKNYTRKSSGIDLVFFFYYTRIVLKTKAQPDFTAGRPLARSRPRPLSRSHSPKATSKDTPTDAARRCWKAAPYEWRKACKRLKTKSVRARQLPWTRNTLSTAASLTANWFTAVEIMAGPTLPSKTAKLRWPVPRSGQQRSWGVSEHWALEGPPSDLHLAFSEREEAGDTISAPEPVSAPPCPAA